MLLPHPTPQNDAFLLGTGAMRPLAHAAPVPPGSFTENQSQPGVPRLRGRRSVSFDCPKRETPVLLGLIHRERVENPWTLVVAQFPSGCQVI